LNYKPNFPKASTEKKNKKIPVSHLVLHGLLEFLTKLCKWSRKGCSVFLAESLECGSHGLLGVANNKDTLGRVWDAGPKGLPIVRHESADLLIEFAGKLEKGQMREREREMSKITRHVEEIEDKLLPPTKKSGEENKKNIKNWFTQFEPPPQKKKDET
jgi:hypothetical protein